MTDFEIIVQGVEHADEAGVEMENLSQMKKRNSTLFEEVSPQDDKRDCCAKCFLYPYREYKRKELINAWFKYPLLLRLWILPLVYAACIGGMMAETYYFWGRDKSRLQNDIISLCVTPFLILCHYHANEWANIYYTIVSKLQRERLNPSLTVWLCCCMKVECLQLRLEFSEFGEPSDCLCSFGKCLIKFLGPCGKSLTDQIIEDYDHGYGSQAIFELELAAEEDSQGGEDTEKMLKRYADQTWEDLDNDNRDDKPSELKRTRFDTMRDYHEPKHDYKLIMKDEIKHTNKVIEALRFVQQAEKAKCWGFCECCKSKPKVIKDSLVLAEDGFMGWTRFILWSCVCSIPLCTVVGTPLIGWFNHINHSWDGIDSSAENYAMHCAIWIVLLTLCMSIFIYYMMVICTIFVEVSAAVRDTIWHWKQRVFFYHKDLFHEALIKQHSGLLLRLDAITGSFNFFIDSILFLVFIFWALNSFYFYKEYIKGNIDRDALPWIGICSFLFLFFAVTLIYSNGFNQMILNAVRIKGWNSAYFERRPAGWKIFGLFMTHELYVKLISTQMVPFFLWIARPEQ